MALEINMGPDKALSLVGPNPDVMVLMELEVSFVMVEQKLFHNGKRQGQQRI